MSLRRSSRQQFKNAPVAEVQNGGIAEKVAAPLKRGRKSKATEDIAIKAIVQDIPSGDADSNVTAMNPPPTTPNKRRKVGKTSMVAPPITPTPSAVGLIASTIKPKPNYSSGDIDDATPPPIDRPVQLNHTNATLVTPGGTQMLPSSNGIDESPSKPSANKNTSATLLKTACDHLIKVDPTLKRLIENFPCHIFSPEGLAEQIDPFRSLSSGIMAQQVSGAAAKSIKNKFIGLFPADQCPNGFPPPSLVAKTSVPRLREAGLSRQKAEYIQGLAEKFESGELNVKALMEGSDDEVKRSLVAVRGLGAWSAEMFMCFGLKRMDVFSTGDLGVQRGMAAHAGRNVAKLKSKGGGKWKYMSEKDMLEMSEKYAPYRSLFMWYMWRVEDTPVDLSAIQDNCILGSQD